MKIDPENVWFVYVEDEIQGGDIPFISRDDAIEFIKSHDEYLVMALYKGEYQHDK